MTRFDGFDKVSITFPGGGGKDTSTQISIEKKSQIFNASCDVEGLNNGFGYYPMNLSVDVGNDGDSQWAFRGNGYGPFTPPPSRWPRSLPAETPP